MQVADLNLCDFIYVNIIINGAARRGSGADTETTLETLNRASRKYNK